MPIDVTKDKLLGLAEAARAVKPVGGRNLHPSTLFRWAIHGIHGVKLEHIRIGRKIATTAECLNRFFAELSKAPTPEHGTRERRPVEIQIESRTPRERERAIATAQARLEATGV